MYLDIGIGVFLLICMGLGYWKGFMRSIVGFAAGVISLAVAIFSASSAADMMDKYVKLSARLEDWTGLSGRMINIFACGATIYLFFRFVFWLLGRFIKKIKEQNKAIDRLDKFGGLVLGLGKCALGLVIFFVAVHLLQSVPVIKDSVRWLMDGSVVGKFIYEIVMEYIIPTVVAWGLDALGIKTQ